MLLLRLVVLAGAALPMTAPCLAGPKAYAASTRCDYGVRLPGMPPPAVFTITNRGDAPLVLRPQPCCGLSVIGSETPIPPGGERRLVINAAHPLADGLFRKTVRVLTNDPGTPEIQLELTAVVKSPMQLFPGDELTFPLNAESIDPQIVLLRCNDEAELRVTSIRTSAPYMHCKEVAPELALGGLNPQRFGISEKQEPGRLRAIEVSVGPGAPATPYEAVVVVGTNCKRRPEVKVRVFGLSPNAVTAQPPRIDFDPLGKDQTDATRMVTLTRALGSFKVLGVTTSDPRMQVTVPIDPSGLFAELLATFRPGPQRGSFRGTITVRTDDPERPRLVIPYAGEAR